MLMIIGKRLARTLDTLLRRLLERFPNMFPIIKYFLSFRKLLKKYRHRSLPFEIR